MEQPDEETISAAELARRLGVNRSAVTRYVQSGKITPLEISQHGFKSRLMFLASDVERIKQMMRDAGSARSRPAQ